MKFPKNKKIFIALLIIVPFCYRIFCYSNSYQHHPEELIIVGGGIAGGMEAYFAFLDAKKNNHPLRITIYEKNPSVSDTTVSNIVPSLTCDEILSVVPRGQELVRKLEILFSKPGGIRVEDVPGIYGSDATENFKQEVQNCSFDEEGHNQKTQALLALGKMSMDLWEEKIYNNADPKFKKILESSNLNLCREPSQNNKVLHDGYRIDLIYNIPNAKDRADGMIRDYESLGYKHCNILSPSEVVKIDSFLKDFCDNHSSNNVWNNDTVALWRPGGCLDAQVFLPQLYTYLKEEMGKYKNSEGQEQDCFQIKFDKKITEIEFAKDDEKTFVSGLKFEDGQSISKNCEKCHYVFCPGESVGTLRNLGLREPAYAGFAGVSLLLNIEIPQEKLDEYSKLNHCMEVHQEGVVLAWQARFRDNKIFIGVAGTKSFYSDQKPNKYQEFARNRNLLQLNMINDVLPEFISLALKFDTKGKTLTEADLKYLEDNNIARRWAGVRSVVFDGFPTIGYAYKDDCKVENARCTTHLGSGGASFSPAVTYICRNSMNPNKQDDFSKRILRYSDSRRNSEKQ